MSVTDEPFVLSEEEHGHLSVSSDSRCRAWPSWSALVGTTRSLLTAIATVRSEWRPSHIQAGRWNLDPASRRHRRRATRCRRGIRDALFAGTVPTRFHGNANLSNRAQDLGFAA